MPYEFCEAPLYYDFPVEAMLNFTCHWDIFPTGKSYVLEVMPNLSVLWCFPPPRRMPRVRGPFTRRVVKLGSVLHANPHQRGNYHHHHFTVHKR